MTEKNKPLVKFFLGVATWVEVGQFATVWICIIQNSMAICSTGKSNKNDEVILSKNLVQGFCIILFKVYHT